MQNRQLGPTRTILITGLNSTEEYDDFIKNIDPDDVLETYTVPNTLFLFIMFYDVRKATNFYTLHSQGHLSLTYTVSKYEIPKTNEDVSEMTKQSSLIIFFKNVLDNSPDSVFIKFLSQFGPVREMRLSKPHQKIVEFFDMRHAKKAMEKLDNSTFGTGTLKCKYVWDIMQYARAEYLKRTDDILKGLLPNLHLPVKSDDNAQVIFKSDQKFQNSVRSDSSFMDNQESESSKRIKKYSENFNSVQKRSIFVSAFDDFIIQNLDKIESIIKNGSK